MHVYAADDNNNVVRLPVVWSAGNQGVGGWLVLSLVIERRRRRRGWWRFVSPIGLSSSYRPTAC